MLNIEKKIDDLIKLGYTKDEVIKMVKEFKKRRDLIVERLNGMGYKTVNAEGAFYVFPKIEDKNFVQKAAKAGVF